MRGQKLTSVSVYGGIEVEEEVEIVKFIDQMTDLSEQTLINVKLMRERKS